MVVLVVVVGPSNDKDLERQIEEWLLDFRATRLTERIAGITVRSNRHHHHRSSTSGGSISSSPKSNRVNGLTLVSPAGA